MEKVNLTDKFSLFVEHLPVADEEVHVLLLEPKSTLNTGNVQNERTVADLKQI